MLINKGDDGGREGGGGGTDAEVKVRTGRAEVFLQMKNIWASPNLIISINIRIFNTTAETVLLCGAETWRTTTTTLKKIQTIMNTWPEIISNRQLWKRTKDSEDGLDTPSESQ